jgi:hypothetical protein
VKRQWMDIAAEVMVSLLLRSFARKPLELGGVAVRLWSSDQSLARSDVGTNRGVTQALKCNVLFKRSCAHNSFLFNNLTRGEAIPTGNMAKDDKQIEEFNDVPHVRKGTRPDFSTPPARKNLPKELQDTLNDEEKLWEVLYAGKYVSHSNVPFTLTSH